MKPAYSANLLLAAGIISLFHQDEQMKAIFLHTQ